MHHFKTQIQCARLLLWISICSLTFGLSGCGGGGGGGGASDEAAASKAVNPISVVPALGAFGAGATVQFLKVDGGLIASGTTNAAGVAVLDMGTYSGPFISSVTGGPNVTFYNEKTQTRESFGANDQLLAISPSVPTGSAPKMGITQLTNAAASVLIADPAKPSFSAGISVADVESQISVANATVAVAAGLPPGLDILSAPRALSSSLDRIDTTDANEAAYGAIVAALAQAGTGASAMQGARSMAADAKANKGALPASATLLQSASANLVNLVNTFVSSSTNSTNLKSLVAKVNPDPTFSRPESKTLVSNAAVTQNRGKPITTVVDLPDTTKTVTPVKPVTPVTPVTGGGGGGGGGAAVASGTSGSAIASTTCSTSTSGTVISVVPGLGLISDGATVAAFNPTNANQIGTSTTSKGFACLNIGTYKGPFILKLSGASGGTYYDAGFGGPVAMDSGESLLALVPTDATNGTKTGSSFGINTFTHMAAAYAKVTKDNLLIAGDTTTINNAMYGAIARTRLALGLPVDLNKTSLTHNLNSLIAQEVTSASFNTIDVSKPGGYMGLFLAELASASASNSSRNLLVLSKSLASEVAKYVAAATADNKSTAAANFLKTNDVVEIRKALAAVGSGVSKYKNSCYSIPSADETTINTNFTLAEKSLNANPSSAQLSEAIVVDTVALINQNNALVYSFASTKASGCQ